LFVLNFPPSEKLSGVIFKMPIKIFFFLFKNSLFEVIFFISLLILDLTNFGINLIFLILIILEDIFLLFFEKISK
jgi:hypothetical protein